MKHIFHREYLYDNRMNVRYKVITDGKGKYFYEIVDKNGTIETSPRICDANGSKCYEYEIMVSNK